jgi:hypothetical protein
VVVLILAEGEGERGGGAVRCSPALTVARCRRGGGGRWGWWPWCGGAEQRTANSGYEMELW